MRAAAASPPQLYNKSVAVGWSVQGVQRATGEQEKGFSTSVSYTIYVSSAGRFFERASRSSGTRTGTRENEPGAVQPAGREARGLRFEGNTLVINRDYSGSGGSGAMRAAISFDSSYSSCSVSVTHGKENGAPVKRKGLDRSRDHIKDRYRNKLFRARGQCFREQLVSGRPPTTLN